MQTRTSGFTLVELGIVLVVIGLIVGGVMAGQNLIRNAELKTIATDFNKYTSAIKLFREKFYELPGDFGDATSQWGAAASCPGTAAATGTCNGDGDGIMEYLTVTYGNEPFRAWQHLALSGILEGYFTGVRGSVGSSDYVVGENCPKSVSPACWGFGYLNNTGGGAAGYFRYDYRNWITLGADDNSYNDDYFLSTKEAWNIDTKIDDGMPALGKVHSGWGITVCTTAANNTVTTATYKLSDLADNRCALLLNPDL